MPALLTRMSTWPKAFIGRVDDGLHVGRLGDIGLEALDPDALRAEALDRRRQPLAAARAEHQAGAGFGEPFGHLFAEAARAAGHDGDTAVQTEQILDGRHRRRI